MPDKAQKDVGTSLNLSLQITNSDLASLVGPLDSNLTQLETFLNVEISRRFGEKPQLRAKRLKRFRTWPLLPKKRIQI